MAFLEGLDPLGDGRAEAGQHLAGRALVGEGLLVAVMQPPVRGRRIGVRGGVRRVRGDVQVLAHPGQVAALVEELVGAQSVGVGGVPLGE